MLYYQCMQRFTFVEEEMHLSLCNWAHEKHISAFPILVHLTFGFFERLQHEIVQYLFVVIKSI